MTLIVDATVVVKWLVPEPGSDRAVELMRGAVVAPESVVTECVNALRKKVLRGELREGHAHVAVLLLEKASCIALESTQPLAEDTLALSLRLSLPAYDCVYLALARRLGGVLITADRRLLARCRRPDAADLAGHVRDLAENLPMVQERPVRGYMARRKAA